ncbi:MAG TPA: hypothetical protein VFX15_03015 [Actinomycetes bacterium]|nr:hypothetical protein [Actinomycetes bacterium]
MSSPTGSRSAESTTSRSIAKAGRPGALDSLRLLLRDLKDIALHHIGVHATETFCEPMYDEYGGLIDYEVWTCCWVCELRALKAERP